MLQVVVIVVVVVVVMVMMVVVMMMVMVIAAVAGVAALQAVRGGQSATVLLPGAGRRRTARGVPLQQLADREPMLMDGIRRRMLHLRALRVQMRVGVRVMQMLAVMRRHQRIPARGRVENRRGCLKTGDRHGRRRGQGESRYQGHAYGSAM